MHFREELDKDGGIRNRQPRRGIEPQLNFRLLAPDPHGVTCIVGLARGRSRPGIGHVGRVLVHQDKMPDIRLENLRADLSNDRSDSLPPPSHR